MNAQPDQSAFAIKPYYSRAFGDQYAVIPMGLLSEMGLEEASGIVAHMDGVRPSRVMRFDTSEQAERYLARRRASDEGRA